MATPVSSQEVSMPKTYIELLKFGFKVKVKVSGAVYLVD